MSGGVQPIDPMVILRSHYDGMTPEQLAQAQRLQSSLRPSGLSASQSISAPGKPAAPGTPASAPPSPQRQPPQQPSQQPVQHAPQQPPPAQPPRRPPQQPSAGMSWLSIALIGGGVIAVGALAYYYFKPASLVDQISGHPHGDSIMKEALLRKAKRELRSKLAK